MKKSPFPWLLLCLALTGLAGCGKSNPSAVAPRAPPAVTVAAPAPGQVRDSLSLDGVVAASASVNLVARVAGILESAPFREGDRVRKGQLLFVIEPASYREQVKLNQARLDQARAEATRQRSLMQDNATAQASVENANSQLQQAEANLRLAQISLDYTQVRAPFDGVIGRRQVDVGNYVGSATGATVLGTVLQTTPAFVNFSVNERDLLRLRGAGAPWSDRPQAGALKVHLTLQGEATPSEEGVMDFVDSGVGAATGSLQLRARFANANGHLIPGLYARVSVDLGPPRDALLVPEACVQADQRGKFVFVVDSRNVVMRRDVDIGELFEDGREVTRGLTTDDRVVLTGLSNVREGQTVAAHAQPRATTRPKVSP